MTQTKPLILVTGATGTQGGGTARALLDAGYPVRILVRNPDAPAALALAARGAEIAKGDMDDPSSLAAAMVGAYGVFSIQKPDVGGSDSERRQGAAMIQAALEAGVRHFVQTSVCQAGTHESFPKWDEGYWAVGYWTHKWEVETMVREAGFETWTILRPSFIMENFTAARAQWLYPQLSKGEIVTPVKPEARIQFIAGDDIGAFARAAFAEPARFGGKTIELASDDLSMAETAEVIGKALNKTVTLKSVSPDEARAAGINPFWVRSQEWINDVRYQVDLSDAAAYGVPMTSLGDWIKRNADQMMVG